MAGLLSVFLGGFEVEAIDDLAVGFVAAAGARGCGRLFTAGFETDTEGLED